MDTQSTDVVLFKPKVENLFPNDETIDEQFFPNSPEGCCLKAFGLRQSVGVIAASNINVNNIITLRWKIIKLFERAFPT